jgi:bleomycin hydrolase
MAFPSTSFAEFRTEHMCGNALEVSGRRAKRKRWEGRDVCEDPSPKRKKISDVFLRKCRTEFSSDPKNILLRNVVVNSGLTQAATDTEEAKKISHIFSNTIVGDVKATDQESSGRCWIFAGLNVMRRFMCKQHNLENFEFSQNYISFWDKLERTNHFLLGVIDTKDKDLEDDAVSWMISDPIADSGEWALFSNLVQKYGVVPLSAMPETFHSGYSSQLNEILDKKLKEFANTLRKMDKASEEELMAKKDEMLQKIYNVLVIFLGQPPVTFTWEYKDFDNDLHSYKGLTPKKFLTDYASEFKVENQVVLTNIPSSERPYYKRYEMLKHNNVVEATSITYINLPITELRKFAVKSIKGGTPIWFGCDVEKGIHSELGALSTSLYNYDLLFGEGEPLNKKERLAYHSSSASHAMVLTGVNLENGRPNRWQVENSWGEDAGKDGFLSMTDDWFSEYVFDIVIDKKYLTKKIKDILKEDSITVKPWENFGKPLVGSCTQCSQHFQNKPENCKK